MQERIINVSLNLFRDFLKKHRKFLIIFLFISICFNLFLCVSSYSQPDSLLKYLEIAGKNNPTVQQKFTEYQAAMQKIPQAGSLPDPQLDMGVFIAPMELVSGNQVADLKLMQMFPWFGVLRNARDEMSLMAKAKYELFNDAKLQVFYDVQRTWYELYKIRKSIGISEKNIEILKSIENLALVRFKAPYSAGGTTGPQTKGMSSGNVQDMNVNNIQGMQSMGNMQANAGSQVTNQTFVQMQSGSMGASSAGTGLSDLYRIQMESGEVVNNLVFLKNQERTVIALFNTYLNRPPASPVFTVDTLPVPDTLAWSLAAVPDSILKKNPMLTMLEFEKRSILARKEMVNKMGYPMIGLGLNYSIIRKNEMSASSMNGKDMIMPMVAVTLPIYRKKYAALRKEAEIMGTSASQNYQATSNLLQAEYYQAFQLYQDALRRSRLYENQFLLASKSLDIILKSFSASATSLTDVLRIRQQTFDYELKQSEAVSDLNKAVAWLKRLMAVSLFQ